MVTGSWDVSPTNVNHTPLAALLFLLWLVAHKGLNQMLSPAWPFTVLNTLATSLIHVDSYVIEAFPLTQMTAAEVKLRCADLVRISCCLLFSVGTKPSLYSLSSPMTTTQSCSCLHTAAPLLSPSL